MAHLANSQIQSHSVGEFYPLVIFKQEPQGSAPYWGIIHGTAQFAPFFTRIDAECYARALLQWMTA